MIEGLRLNLTDQEASSEARTYEVPPSGAYMCNIVELNDETVKPGSDNAGKPYWRARFVIDQGSQYDGTPLFSNIMLFEGAAFQITQLVRSVFPDLIDGNTLSIPAGDAFIGKQVLVTGIKHRAGSNMVRKGKIVGKYEKDQFDVKGFRAVDNTAPKKTANEYDLP